MILALLLLQVADSVTAITVREGDRTAAVPIVFTASGPMVQSDQVFPPLGGKVTLLSRDRYAIEVGGATLELSLGLPVVRVNGEVVPLAAAPVERTGKLFVPLGIITDVMPRFAIGYVYDHAQHVITHYVPSVAALPEPSTSLESPRSPRLSRAMSRRDGSREHPWLVVVDAGHGGPDRGMKGPLGSTRKIEEADITLAVSKRLRDALKARGARVVMTRTTDTLIALADRGKIANTAEANLFLSIHINAANPSWGNPRSAIGFETYFLSDAKTEDEKRVEEMENDASKYELDVDVNAGDPLSYLLADMRENEDLRESSELAAIIQLGLNRVRPGLDRGVKQAGFHVLVAAHMPAVLVEIGFGTNPSEMRYLASRSGQAALAGAIARATMTYLEQYRSRTRAGAGTR